MPRDQCPPSRRGHSWRELILADLPRGSIAALKIAPALRLCKRCGALGRVSGQGVIHVVEVP
ncbi:MAG TPA: hypothetical protein VLE97_05685 [Gaiellaceae bacterium]|nr:hypothetical protein [Gaiellaceae bacterium]